MARNIFIVNATQVVVSESHPEGLFSVISGFPKTFDSCNYEGETAASLALNAAKAEYFDRLSKNYVGSANRVMSTVTLSMANGRQILNECIGTFPAEQGE